MGLAALSRDTRRRWGPPLRVCGVVVAFACAGALAVALVREPLTTLTVELDAGVPWSALPLELLLGCVAALALAGCGLWLTAVVVATVVEALTGASSAAIRAVSPHVVRRLVLMCCGVAVAGSSVLPPAMAVDHRPGEASGAATAGALSGLPLPDRAVGEAPAQRPRSLEPWPTRPKPYATQGYGGAGSVRAAEVTAPSGQASPGRSHVGVHRVREGESLWSIAERLRPRADVARLDAAWRRVYRRNRREIGPDPDLIIPGTSLHLPPAARAVRLDQPEDLSADHHRKDAS